MKFFSIKTRKRIRASALAAFLGGGALVIIWPRPPISERVALCQSNRQRSVRHIPVPRKGIHKQFAGDIAFRKCSAFGMERENLELPKRQQGSFIWQDENSCTYLCKRFRILGQGESSTLQKAKYTLGTKFCRCWHKKHRRRRRAECGNILLGCDFGRVQRVRTA